MPEIKSWFLKDAWIRQKRQNEKTLSFRSLKCINVVFCIVYIYKNKKDLFGLYVILFTLSTRAISTYMYTKSSTTDKGSNYARINVLLQ